MYKVLLTTFLIIFSVHLLASAVPLSASADSSSSVNETSLASGDAVASGPASSSASATSGPKNGKFDWNFEVKSIQGMLDKLTDWLKQLNGTSFSDMFNDTEAPVFEEPPEVVLLSEMA